MVASHLVIRFYTSIEDGECGVGRDLGLLASFNEAHQNVNGELANDLILARSDPIETSDICADEVAVGTESLANALEPTQRRKLTFLQQPSMQLRRICSKLASTSSRWMS